MGHIMPNNISLTLTPNFITSPPQIKIFINNELIHDGDLQDKKEWIHTTNIDRSLRLRIIRSGRTKDISHRDNANGLQITDYTVNGVKIDPAIGSYNVSNNDYVETRDWSISGRNSTAIPVIDGKEFANFTSKLDPFFRQTLAEVAKAPVIHNK